MLYPSGIGKIFHKYVIDSLTFTTLVRPVHYSLCLYKYNIILEAVDMSILYQNKNRSDSSCEAPTILTSTPRYNIE